MVHKPNRPQMTLTEAIHRRTSIRAYTGEPLAPEHLSMLKGVAKSAPRLTGTPVRLAFIEGSEKVSGILKGIVGNYGKIKDAPTLIVGIAGEGPYPLESLGFVMEYVVLEATRHNIGTCWNSGMFSQNQVKKEISLEAGEEVLAVSPAGYPAPSAGQDILKSLVGAKKRKELKNIVYANSWGQDAQALLADRPELQRICEAVRWAPSAVNRQPWRLILTPEATVLTSANRNSGLDNGIAMAHWHIAAHEEGLEGSWDLEPDAESLKKTLQIPDDMVLVGVYPLES